MENGKTMNSLNEDSFACIDKDNRLRNAIDLFNKGDFRESQEICRNILRADCSNSSAYNILGCSLEQLGDLTGAYESFKQASRIKPNNSNIYFKIGNILQQQSE